jgi:hypothetical protein
VTDNRDSATPTVTGRVATGATLLDHVGLDGWWRWVNLDSLNLTSSRLCVLGQLYGSDVDGAVALGLNWAATVDCGFDRHLDEPRDVFGELTDEWKRVIRERRAAVA